MRALADPLLPTVHLGRRAEQAASRYFMSRLANVPGGESKSCGDVVALSARYLGAAVFNRVVGLTDARVEALPELIAWYAQREIRPTFEIVPGMPCTDVMTALAAAGYRHSGFNAMLYGRARPTLLPPAPGVSVEPVDQSNYEMFLDAYAAGRQIPDPAAFKRDRQWLGRPGWSLYLGRYQGHAAGAAILYMDAATGYCADCAVDPAFRSRGVHLALLQRRCEDAARAGADLLCAEADYLSTSYHNMLRAGLVLMYTKACWTGG